MVRLRTTVLGPFGWAEAVSMRRLSNRGSLANHSHPPDNATRRSDPSPAPIALPDRRPRRTRCYGHADCSPSPDADRRACVPSLAPQPPSARRPPRRTNPMTHTPNQTHFARQPPVPNQTHFKRQPPASKRTQSRVGSNPIARRIKPNRVPNQTQSRVESNPIARRNEPNRVPNQTQSRVESNPIARRNEPIFVPSATPRIDQTTLFVSSGYEEKNPAAPESNRQRWGSSRSRPNRYSIKGPSRCRR